MTSRTTTRTKGGTGKMTARDHQFEVGTCLEEIKSFQDRVLDIYDPKDRKKIKLLEELVFLQNELEDLDKQFEKYIEENCWPLRRDRRRLLHEQNITNPPGSSDDDSPGLHLRSILLQVSCELWLCRRLLSQCKLLPSNFFLSKELQSSLQSSLQFISTALPELYRWSSVL